MSDLADSIKRLCEHYPIANMDDPDCLNKGLMPEAIQTINQLVELVAEMREVLAKCKRDYDVALNNSYDVEALMGSLPERMQNDINRKFVAMQLDGINQAKTKADALLEELKEKP